MKRCKLFYLIGLLFFLAAALNFVTGGDHATAVVWRCLFVARVFAAEKIKQQAGPGGKRTTGAAILCGARSYSRQNDQISTKTRYVYVNQTDRFHCRDPL